VQVLVYIYVVAGVLVYVLICIVLAGVVVVLAGVVVCIEAVL